MNKKGNKKAPNLFRMGLCRSLLDFLERTNGAGGRNRTDMELPPLDFESSASTSFTTPAILHVVWGCIEHHSVGLLDSSNNSFSQGEKENRQETNKLKRVGLQKLKRQENLHIRQLFDCFIPVREKVMSGVIFNQFFISVDDHYKYPDIV